MDGFAWHGQVFLPVLPSIYYCDLRQCMRMLISLVSMALMVITVVGCHAGVDVGH